MTKMPEMPEMPVWCIASFLVVSGVVGNLFENALAAPSGQKVARANSSSAAAAAIARKTVNKSVAAAGTGTVPLSGNSSIIFSATSIGKLYALEKNWNVVRRRNDDKFLCLAKGTVSVQPDVPLSLKLDYSLTTRPELLVVPYSNVVQINCDGIEFDDRICEPISKCSSVVRVDLTSSDVSDNGVLQLCKMKQLKALILAKTLIKGSCLQALSGTGLQYLDISDNKVDLNNIKYLALLDHVVTVRLNYDNLTDECVKSIAHMKSLRDLELRGNLKLTDDAVKNLLPLKNLQRIVMRDSKITVVALEALLKNLQLREVTVDDKILENPAGKRLLKEYSGILNPYPTEQKQDVNIIYAPLK
jgi:hypothetical protein